MSLRTQSCIQVRSDTMSHKVPKDELDARLAALRAALTQADPAWQMAILGDKISMYYFTGTMQVGAFVVTPDSAVLWVRRDLGRAQEESLFPDIRPMKSFRSLGEAYPVPQAVWLDKKTVTLEWLDMVRKYLPFQEIKPIGGILNALRARKSVYEQELLREAGVIHAEVMHRVLPGLLREGISEAELGGLLNTELLRRGSMGISRYNQPLGEDIVGLVSFSENALRATAFDGPGGTAGTCTAVQAVGSPEHRLKKGDLVFVDVPAGREGYHTDKTVVYYFGDLGADPDGGRMEDASRYCVEIEGKIASMLVPGAIPEEIYNTVMDGLDPQYAGGFMSGGKFLGHSIGLMMDEPPVLARGFREPIEAGMVFAVEPKIALEGVGLVGTENTYLVMPDGPAQSLSGWPIPLTEVE
ncbi:MAG: aminopeptidase P family protein [Clostridiaceae bacterium]|nr:aminopeptidase P family protein [Clostridiaceae bacterium]